MAASRVDFVLSFGHFTSNLAKRIAINWQLASTWVDVYQRKRLLLQIKYKQRDIS